MMKISASRLLCVSLLSAFSVLITGCIESPLLNHANARTEREDFSQNEPNSDASCDFYFQQSGLCASLLWEKKQSGDSKGAFTIRFWEASAGDGKGPFIDPNADVRVELWMTSMSHGTWPKPILTPALDADQLPVPGVFRVERVYFMMPGPWDIRLQLFEGETLIEQAQIPYVQPSW